MAVTEQNGLMKYKDKAGNLYILYPITNADNVDGLTELIEPVSTAANEAKTAAATAQSKADGADTKATNAATAAATAQSTANTAKNLATDAKDSANGAYTTAEKAMYTDFPSITAGTGSAYTATVSGIESMEAGISFVMIPHTASTSQTATLNVNGLGAKTLRRPLSGSNSATTAPDTAAWLAANKPIRVTYDGTYWVVDMPKPDVTDLYGEVASGPKAVTITLASGGWSSNTQTVTVNGILADETKQLIQVNPASASRTAYISAGIICSGQAANSLTFTCTTTPTSNLTVYVTYQEVT